MGAKKDTGKVEYTDDEKKVLVGKVCDLYASNTYTVASCCKSVGISDRLFRYWVAQNGEFSEIYKKAKERNTEIYWDILREKAQSGLEVLVSGKKYIERKTESGEGPKGSFSKDTETEVTVLPNPTAVIFALKGEYPGRFSDKLQHTGTDGGPIKLETNGLSLEEQVKLLELLEKMGAADGD